jgi:hypothetical protein
LIGKVLCVLFKINVHIFEKIDSWGTKALFFMKSVSKKIFLQIRKFRHSLKNLALFLFFLVNYHDVNFPPFLVLPLYLSLTIFPFSPFSPPFATLRLLPLSFSFFLSFFSSFFFFSHHFSIFPSSQ